MIYVKKLLASCAALALAATSILPMTVAADAASDGQIVLVATPDAATYKAGDTVTVKLTIKSNDGVNGWATLVKFDDGKLTYNSVKQNKIVETVPGYPNVKTESKIQQAPPAADVTDSVKVVWAEGTATYQAIFDDNDVDCPAEFVGKNYVFTGTNDGNPVAEIRFTAKEDIDFTTDKNVVSVEGEKATKNDATDPLATYDVGITVNNEVPDLPPVEEVTIKLSNATATIEEGKTGKLTATVTGTEDPVVWTSSNEAVATVAADGTVTAVKAGTADITATVGGKSATCKVTVKKTPVTPIPVNIGDQTVKEGEKLEFDLAQLLAPVGITVTPEMVAALPVTVNDTTIATYEVDGTKVIFNGVKAGTTKVSVTSPSANYTFSDFNLIVTPINTDIVTELNIPNQTVTEGMTTSFNIGNAILEAILPNLEVKSLNENIATVQFSSDMKSLVINGNQPGTAKAQVTDKNSGAVLGVFEITVEKAPDPVDDDDNCVVDFKEKTIQMTSGEKKQLALVISPVNDKHAAEYTDITTWDLVSSDPTVATVDANGKVTALKAGKVTITGTRPGYTGSIKCNITVFSVFPVYNPVQNPGETVGTKPSDYNPGRAKVSPYVNAIVDSESKASTNNSSSNAAGPIAATGGEFDSETGNAPAIAAGALGLIALGFVVVARKKRHS
jgi:hypothetical protein